MKRQNIKKIAFKATSFVVGVLLFVSVLLLSQSTTSAACASRASLCEVGSLLTLPASLATVPAPKVDTPEWMKPKTTVTYSVETRGTITTDLATFKAQANETLNDSRGWSRLDVVFKEVASGGSFTLVLSEASQVPSFAPTVCSEYYSCNVGRYVIINQDRWVGATDPWNAAGGSLRDYRHMVVNHETGHWLGHGHEYCGGAGQQAPVMQQQSMGLQGCVFNPWPLSSEIWTTRL
jgi:hypothetical protein